MLFAYGVSRFSHDVAHYKERGLFIGLADTCNTLDFRVGHYLGRRNFAECGIFST